MTASPVEPLLFIGGLSVVTFVVFGNLLGSLRLEGGKIRAKTFDFPELLISIVLGGAFIALVVKAGLAPATADAPKVTLDQVMPNALFFVILFVSITAFLKYRGIDIRDAMGFTRVPIARALGRGFALILAAFPLVLCASLIAQMILRQEAQEQELVTLFKQVAKDSNSAGVAQILFAGAIIAPICEEFLFRGFFYVVFKRYLGAVGSAVLTSALFAAFHVSLTAFPSLFVLALCFTIAFESSGSLVVPITMHAIFNGAQLGFLYYVTRSGVVG